MNNNVNWADVEYDFVHGDYELNELAALYNSSGRSMRRHCLEGCWWGKKAEFVGNQILSAMTPVTGASSSNHIQLDTRQDNMALTVRSESIKTVDEALRVAQVDLNEWEVTRNVVRSAGMRNRWQIQVWLKRRVFNIEKALDAVETAFTNLPPLEAIETSPIYFADEASGLIEISLPDLHLGKLSWNAETGHGDGDLSLILEAARETIIELVRKARLYHPEKIVLIVGNDLLHVDNLEGTTTKGTPQDVDGRPQKLFEAAIGLYRMAITMLSRIAPVDVVMLPGNHDKYTLPHLGSALKGYFHNNKRVAIDNEIKSRKYYRFGNVLLGYCHGDRDDPKLEDLPLLMMRENQSIISKIKWMEWHVGHLHKRKEMSWLSLESDTGIQVRHLPALCVPDKWHTQHGFVGQPRAADIYMWDKEDGYQGHRTYNYIKKEKEGDGTDE